MNKEEIKQDISIKSRLQYITDEEHLKVIDFIMDYSFKDSKEVYTNGTILVPLYRVLDAIEQKGNKYQTLEGVPLLPPLEQEDDVEKLAEEEYPIIPNTSPNVNWDRANKQEGFERGYNKAKEKYKFLDNSMERR